MAQAHRDAIHPDDRFRRNKVLADHLERGARYDVDYRIRTKFGKAAPPNSPRCAT